MRRPSFLLLALLLAARQPDFISQARMAYLAPWIHPTFAAGSLVAAVRFGDLTRYELVNKDAGAASLAPLQAVTTTVTDWEDLRRILRVFTISVVAENIVAVAAFLANYFLEWKPVRPYGGLRLSGMLLDPNAYGGLLVVALVICEGGSWGTGVAVQDNRALGFQADPGLGNSVHFFALGMGGPRLCFRGSLRRACEVAARLVLAILMALPVCFCSWDGGLPILQEWPAGPNRSRESLT